MAHPHPNQGMCTHNRGKMTPEQIKVMLAKRDATKKVNDEYEASLSTRPLRDRDIQATRSTIMRSYGAKLIRVITQILAYQRELVH